jgi:DNA-binding beta-propeller fold protein YncE
MNRLLTNILLFLCCNTFAFSNSEMLTVVEQTAGRISFYDTADGKVVGSIKIGSKPHELNISKDNKTAYATNFGLQDYDETIGVAGTSISVIDIPGRVEKFRLYTFDAEDKKDFSNIDKAPHGLELRPPEEKQ